MGMPYIVDDSATPLVVLTCSDFDREDELLALEDDVRRLYEAREPLCFLADLRCTRLPRAELRRSVSAMQARLEPLSVRYALGTVLVTDGAITRAAMTAIRWTTPPVVPEHFVGDFDQAGIVIRGLFDRRGIPRPSCVDRRLARLASGARIRELAVR